MNDTLKEMCNRYFIEMEELIDYNLTSLNNLKNPEKYNFISNLATSLNVIQKYIKRDLEELKTLIQFPIQFMEASNKLIETCDKFTSLFKEFKELYKEQPVSIFTLQNNYVVCTKGKCEELKQAYYNKMSPVTKQKLDMLEKKEKSKVKVFKEGN